MQDFCKQLKDLIKRKGKQLNQKKEQAIKRIQAKDITGTCFNYSKHAAPINKCTNSQQLAKKEQEISEEVEQLSIQAQVAEAERKEKEEKNERLRKEQEEEQDRIIKESADRSSSYEKILTTFDATSPTVFFDDLDPTL
jgi:hypothetical protein